MIWRKKELNILQNAYESSESQLVAIYGRRRIGKTYLVNEAFGHHFAFDSVGRDPVWGGISGRFMANF